MDRSIGQPINEKIVLKNILDFLKAEQEELIVQACSQISDSNLVVAAMSRLGLIHELTTMIENVLDTTN